MLGGNKYNRCYIHFSHTSSMLEAAAQTCNAWMEVVKVEKVIFGIRRCKRRWFVWLNIAMPQSNCCDECNSALVTAQWLLKAVAILGQDTS